MALLSTSLPPSASPSPSLLRSPPITAARTPSAAAAVAHLRRSEAAGRWGAGAASISRTTSGPPTSASKGDRVPLVRSSLNTAGLTLGTVTEVGKDTFWPLVEAAGDKVVVLDMYTQWCGPCKVMAPKFQELSEKHLDVLFLKLDCNQDNKSLAKELGIRVVPTFKILKDGKVVKEVTGAKFDDLVLAIETIKSS